MSNQVSLTLRPPPNVEHVDGYPGIPPGPNRPQASVRGSIELRTGPAGVKAKWVRVELRKIETLPGGGQVNTFFDFVGPSPVTLWQADPDAEYALLGTRDFQFTIRIPESTPPSVNLASDLSGIRYELVASVCTKGKKGFLRKRKSIVVSTTTPIIIDKHELHSMWPVYNQPEARHLTQDGVTLEVQRDSTCYGPGDELRVIATVKSESLNTIILRGFEIQLKETSIFRSGPFNNSGKKSSPQVRVLSVAEAKLPVNATLYGGNSHTSPLSTVLSPSHTTTTLNTARHIDVTYVLAVKALMGTGNQIMLELPVVISNWQKNVSSEALRRIGHVPSLSLTSSGIASPPPTTAQTFSGHHTTNPSFDGGHRERDWGTAPVPSSARGPIDEFGGYNAPPSSSSHHNHSYNGVGGSSSSPPRATGRTSTSQNRPLTIVNDVNGEIPASSTPPPSRQGQGRAPAAAAAALTTKGAGERTWLSAEEEKRMMYEKAKADVERVQGGIGGGSPPPPISSTPPPPAAAPQVGGSSSSASAAAPLSANHAKPNKQWLTAEEEKAQLYNRAQAAVNRTQGFADADPSSVQMPTPSHYRNDSASRAGGSSSPAPATIAQPTARKPSGQQPKYMTADQEKEMMKRYDQATQAVAKTQTGGGSASPPPMSSSAAVSSSAPVAYDALYPSSVTGSGSGAASGGSASPPPFSTGGGGGGSALSEKERLRRAYEAQDAQAAAAVMRDRQLKAQHRQPSSSSGHSVPASPPAQTHARSDVTPPYSPPPFDGGGGFRSQEQPGLNEKEVLRRKYESEDRSNGLDASSPPPPAISSTPPPAAFTPSSPPPQQRQASYSTPMSPPPSGTSGILSAVEEKAMLAARYAAENGAPAPAPPARRPTANGVNGSSSASAYATPPSSPPPAASSSSSAAPPPLKPRPPQEYIRETQEEDARVSKYALGGGGYDLNGSGSGTPKLPGGAPFTPFASKFEGSNVVPGTPPVSEFR